MKTLKLTLGDREFSATCERVPPAGIANAALAEASAIMARARKIAAFARQQSRQARGLTEQRDAMAAGYEAERIAREAVDAAMAFAHGGEFEWANPLVTKTF
jgi:hypothetical protein